MINYTINHISCIVDPVFDGVVDPVFYGVVDPVFDSVVDPVFDGVWLAGFKSRSNAFLLA